MTNEELRKDKMRLDWLASNGCVLKFYGEFYWAVDRDSEEHVGDRDAFREAIDIAMEKTNA